MHVVAELALRDGPRLLVVALESRYLRADHRRAAVPVVIDRPVVDAAQEV